MRSIAGIASLAAVAGLIFGLVTWQSDSAATPDRVVTTVPGQRLTIALDDGIKATLAPATTLRVTSHGVTVHGEAHFHVAHVSHRPFTVQTDNAVVRVLGTAFSVRRYDGEHESRIVVTEGKVVLTAGASHARAHESVVLTAGMFGRVNDSVIQSAAQVPVHNYIGWDDGRLVFKRVPLTEVAAELSRAYGTRVSVRDTTLGKQPMTLDAVVDTQPLTQVLEFISRVTGAHYKRVDSTFVLVPGRVAGNDSQKQSLPQPERSYGTYGK